MRTLSLSLLVAMAVLAGCGSSDSSSTTEIYTDAAGQAHTTSGSSGDIPPDVAAQLKVPLTAAVRLASAIAPTLAAFAKDPSDAAGGAKLAAAAPQFDRLYQAMGQIPGTGTVQGFTLYNATVGDTARKLADVSTGAVASGDVEMRSAVSDVNQVRDDGKAYLDGLGG